MKSFFKNKSRIAAGLLVLAVLFLMPGGLFAAVPSSQKFTTPEINPAFVAWQKRHAEENSAGKSGLIGNGAGRNEYPVGGYIPAPYDIGYMLKRARAKKPLSVRSTLSGYKIPEKYDLRNVGGKSYIPGNIGQQSPLGTCWIFAVTEAMQSNMLKQGLADNTSTDISQWGIVFGAYNNESETKGGKQCWGITSADSRDHDPYPYYTGAGNDTIAIGLMTRGSGPVLEKAAPYPYDEHEALKPGQPVPPRSFTPVYSLRDVNIVEFDEWDIKKALMMYGALSVGISNWKHAALSDDAHNYYYNKTGDEDSGDGGHAITLIGWDDSYAKENFKNSELGIEPSSDGAWIFKNSWGSDWGDGGYFYVSYETKGFEYAAYAYIPEPADNSETIYQYDMYGYDASICPVDETVTQGSFANVFTAKHAGSLDAVSFWTFDNARYEIRIYTNCDGTSPTSGTLAHTQWGSIMPGYHKIALTKSVPIQWGKKFSVVVSVTDESLCIGIPVCENLEDFVDKATAEPGRGFFVFGNGTEWEDIAVEEDRSASICLKAYVHDTASSGCNAGFGVLVLLFAVPLIIKNCWGEK